jgi:hypothetical protein
MREEPRARVYGISWSSLPPLLGYSRYTLVLLRPPYAGARHTTSFSDNCKSRISTQLFWRRSAHRGHFREELLDEVAARQLGADRACYASRDALVCRGVVSARFPARRAYFFISTSSPSAHARATAKFPCSSPGILSQPPFVMTLVRS